MSATITYLSTAVRIGGHSIMLKTDSIPSLEDIETALATGISAGLTFTKAKVEEEVNKQFAILGQTLKTAAIDIGNKAIDDTVGETITSAEFTTALSDGLAAAVFGLEMVDNGLSFKMNDDQVITVRLSSVNNWLADTLGAVGGLPTVFTNITGEDASKYDIITVNLWNISLNTKGMFTFNVQVNFDKTFYDAIGIPTAVTDIFSVDSLGIGVRYEKDLTTTGA